MPAISTTGTASKGLPAMASFSSSPFMPGMDRSTNATANGRPSIDRDSHRLDRLRAVGGRRHVHAPVTEVLGHHGALRGVVVDDERGDTDQVAIVRGVASALPADPHARGS